MHKSYKNRLYNLLIFLLFFVNKIKNSPYNIYSVERAVLFDLSADYRWRSLRENSPCSCTGCLIKCYPPLTAGVVSPRDREWGRQATRSPENNSPCSCTGCMIKVYPPLTAGVGSPRDLFYLNGFYRACCTVNSLLAYCLVSLNSYVILLTALKLLEGSLCCLTLFDSYFLSSFLSKLL